MKRIFFGFIVLALFFTACATAKPGAAAAQVSGQDDLDMAIRKASDYINENVPGGIKLVILNIKSNYPPLSEYIIDVLTGNVVNDRVFTVVDRVNLEQIQQEMEFQLSGEVSDESAQSIGQKLGAQSIVTGSITPFGNLWRLTIRALGVEGATVQGLFNLNISNGTSIAALTSDGYVVAMTPPRTASVQPPTPAATVQEPAPVQQSRRQVSESDLVGVWKGSYLAGQGETSLILSVYEERGAYMAIFDFYNPPGKSNSREGKYYMQVSYNQLREKFYLKGIEWIEQPGGYDMADLDGTITRDVFSGFLSGTNYTFRVIRQETN
jgi:hypothetical protein